MNNESNTSNEVNNNPLNNEQVTPSGESNTITPPTAPTSEPNVTPVPPVAPVPPQEPAPTVDTPSVPAEPNPVPAPEPPAPPVEPVPHVEPPVAPQEPAPRVEPPVPPAEPSPVPPVEPVPNAPQPTPVAPSPAPAPVSAAAPEMPAPAPTATGPVPTPAAPQEPTNNDQTIGTIKKEKKSIVPVILIFVVIIGVCVALPYIYSFISPYFEKKTPNPTPSNPTEPINPSPEEPENPSEESNDPVAILPESTIKYGDLTFKNMTLVEEDTRYYISYTITNEGTDTYMGDETLYLEIYNSENTFLGRTKVPSILSLNVGGNITSRSELSDAVYSSASKVGVTTKTEADYPNVTLNETNTLVCRKGINTVTYTFVDNKLTTFNDTYNYSIAKTETEKYTSDVLRYRNMLNSYINYGAIISLVENETETDSTFTASLTITLTDALTSEQQTVLKNMNSSIFAKDTAPKVVKFEQEANAFICE